MFKEIVRGLQYGDRRIPYSLKKAFTRSENISSYEGYAIEILDHLIFTVSQLAAFDLLISTAYWELNTYLSLQNWKAWDLIGKYSEAIENDWSLLSHPFHVLPSFSDGSNFFQLFISLYSSQYGANFVIYSLMSKQFRSSYALILEVARDQIRASIYG